MISKAQISFVTSLQQKKYRKQHQLFVVEGYKSIVEFIQSPLYAVRQIYCTAKFSAKIDKISGNIKYEEISEKDLKKISSLKTPQGVLALVEIPDSAPIAPGDLNGEYTFVLDDLQDPGNLGTIIRTLDWFGFKKIICSLETVEAYNPKVVQASMGSLSRVSVIYKDLKDLYKRVDGLPIYATALNGSSIYQDAWAEPGLIVLGNEGQGISEVSLEASTTKINIPKLGQAESLNVAIATTVFCSEIARKKL